MKENNVIASNAVCVHEFTLVGTGVGALRCFYLLFVRVRACGCVYGCGEARPSPAVLFGSVDLHSKMYMLVFTFCFSNKNTNMN